MMFAFVMGALLMGQKYHSGGRKHRSLGQTNHRSLGQTNHRSIMTYFVGHSSEFPALVDKTISTRGAINTAAPICFNPGRIGPAGINISKPYCLDGFLNPMREKDASIQLHPIVQMANEVLLYNLKHFGGTTRTFKRAAIEFSDAIDGFLFYPQLASKVGHQGDYKALVQLLNLWADEMHSINKTLGVFVPNYHSKFSPSGVLEATRIDYWLTNLEVKECSEIAEFYWGLKGRALHKGGGTLFTSDGAFNSVGCMEKLFSPQTGTLPESNASNIGFYTDFSSMGSVWWEPLATWAKETN